MPPVIVRLTASPALPAKALAEAKDRLGALGRVVLAVNDSDLAISVASARLAEADLSRQLPALAKLLAPIAAERFFRLELMAADLQMLPDEENLRATTQMLESELSTVVIASHRAASMHQWALSRPFRWGRRGIDFGDMRAPAHLTGCLGLSVEFGSPTIIYKARLESMPYSALTATCAAVGGPNAGFADVGAYPATSAVDGASVIVVEAPEASRVPLGRVLDVIDIEARRHGAHASGAALLSHVPLESLLAVLRANTGLAVETKQIVETHLR